MGDGALEPPPPPPHALRMASEAYTDSFEIDGIEIKAVAIDS